MTSFLAGLMSDKKFSTDLYIQQISLEKIKPDANQIRQNIDEERLKELAESIREKGIQNPLHVLHLANQGDSFVIITGERRYRAAAIAGLTHVPCLVHTEQLEEREIRCLQLIENLQREDLGVLDTAKGFQTLLQQGMSQREISKTLGISEGSISRYLCVLKLPADWLAQLEELAKQGKSISIKEIYTIAKESNANKRKALFQEFLGHEAEEEEEPPKEVTTFSHRSDQEVDVDRLWEALKRAVRKDKQTLLKYISVKKAAKILADFNTESQEEEAKLEER